MATPKEQSDNTRVEFSPKPLTLKVSNPAILQASQSKKLITNRAKNSKEVAEFKRLNPNTKFSDEEIYRGLATGYLVLDDSKETIGPDPYAHLDKEALRKARIIYTPEDIEKSKQLAEAHNTSFFGGMVAPPISQELAERDPFYVNRVISQNAKFLPQTILMGMSTPGIISGSGWSIPTIRAANIGLGGNMTILGVDDIIKNGPTFGNIFETTIGGSIIAPSVISGTLKGFLGLKNGFRNTYNQINNSVRRIYDNGTLWDKYTTIGGRFGYYGNPLLRILGTVSRNLGVRSSPKHPELLRKLNEFPTVTEEGLLNFNSHRVELLGKGHSNWTLDRPVVSHKKGNWDGSDLFIVDPKEFQKVVPKENVISIEPSDMFVLNADVFINPKKVTLVSGNPKSLIRAKKMGISTLSSPRLRRFYISDLPKTGEFYLGKGNYGNRLYSLEQQRLQLRRGAPTVKDFNFIENQYGLNSGVIPTSEYLLNSLSNAIKHMQLNPTQIRSWFYPNGREVQLIPGGTYLNKALYEASLINKAPYKNVFYDPASHVEINSNVTNRAK